jgi:hypothetical protein
MAEPRYEEDLASDLGLPRWLVRQFRKTLPPEFYVKTAQGIQIAPEGVDRLYRHFRSCESQKTRPPGQDPSPDPIPDLSTLRVTKVVLNPRIILATDGTSILRVRVRNNSNFLPGMEIRARRLQADLYELQGPCPRRKGRW